MTLRDRILAAARVAILAGIYVLALLVLRGVVSAQDAHPADRPELVRRLAAVCVAEAGWSTDTGDCAAIVSLLMRRADRLGLRPRVMVRAYSSRHFDRERTDRRRWIAHLALDGSRPRGWPRQLAWERYRPRWLATVEHVRAVLRGEVADPCGGEADHWGGPMDDHRARRAGWTRVECSAPTRNRFWRVPGRERS